MIILDKKDIGPEFLTLTKRFKHTRIVPSLRTLKIIVNRNKAYAIAQKNKKLENQLQKLSDEIDGMNINESDTISIRDTSK